MLVTAHLSKHKDAYKQMIATKKVTSLTNRNPISQYDNNNTI